MNVPIGRPGVGPRWAKFGLVGLLVLTLALMLLPIRDVGGGLSALGDDYSEGAAARAGEGFAARGFLETYGLPDVSYGGRYLDKGLSVPTGIRPDDPVYHGDPPGAYWYLGLLMSVGGPDRLQAYRLISVGLAFAATACFAGAMLRTLGAGRALFVLAACLAVPMFTSMAHGLYYHGPALSLLLVEVAILLLYFAADAPAAPTMAGLGVVGLLQGWLSYHYGGLVALSPVPIALLVTPADRPIPWGRVALAVLVAGSAFVLAHAIHFGQSVLYFGSVGEALAEYRFRSGKLYGLADTEWAVAPRWQLLLYGIGKSVVAYFRWTHLLAPASVALTAAWLGSLFVVSASAATRRWVFGAEARGGRRQILAVLVAAAIVKIWIVLMPFHAINHMAYTGRQLFLVYLCMALALATTVRCRVGRLAPSPDRHRRRPAPELAFAEPADHD